MKNNSDHTFVVLAYKESDYIEECIESLLNQTPKSSIIISTSSDNSFIKDIAKRYHLPLFINKKTRGLAQDWSFAFAIPETKYVTLAHQDDIYASDYTKKALKASEKAQQSLITFTDYSELAGSTIRRKTPLLLIKKIMLMPFFLFSNSITSLFLKKIMLSFGSPVCCPSVMYNKKELGAFAFNPHFKINPDWEAWVRLAQKKGSFVYVDENLMQHRIHSDSETTAGLKNNARQGEDLIMFKKLLPNFLALLIAKFYSFSYLSNKR